MSGALGLAVGENGRRERGFELVLLQRALERRSRRRDQRRRAGGSSSGARRTGRIRRDQRRPLASSLLPGTRSVWPAKILSVLDSEFAASSDCSLIFRRFAIFAMLSPPRTV